MESKKGKEGTSNLSSSSSSPPPSTNNHILPISNPSPSLPEPQTNAITTTHMAAEKEPDLPTSFFILLSLLLPLLGELAASDSLESDTRVLIQLKHFLEAGNTVNRGRYSQWNTTNTTAAPVLSVCNWSGVTCGQDDAGRRRVVGLDLSHSTISNAFFNNFSALSALASLDLSRNYIPGQVHTDLADCGTLRRLNLSHNLLSGELFLPPALETVDLTLNRLSGGLASAFPAACGSLRVLNLSANRLTGDVAGHISGCPRLSVVDISSNNFTGALWPGFAGLAELSVSENNLTGEIPAEYFAANCALQSLDLSENEFSGGFPAAVANCQAITYLNIWGNQFTGRIPPEIGLLSNLESLLLGKNRFVNEIPESLLDCRNLTFLDVSKVGFGGDVQPIFGRFLQLRFLVLHGNNYTGGLETSGVLDLPNLIRLDLSFNRFSGELPRRIADMEFLVFLVLANNNFSGEIPAEYGRLARLQALDLSFNRLSGSIPPAIGNLTSLLWLMLAGNFLSGEIPREIGNCSSLLWLNLADNALSGKIPPEVAMVGRDPSATFEANRRVELSRAASGECLSMRRWIPATYPPFSFAYTVLNRKSCRSLWDGLLKGHMLFPVCSKSGVRSFAITGYVQLTGNRLSGEIPPRLGEMQNFTVLHLGNNGFFGRLPAELMRMPLTVLNVSSNALSGEIPGELGDVRCLQNLDLSNNSFSGEFPASLSKLHELNKFNISYNPLLTGEIPADGQLFTFDADSFLGNPLLVWPTHGRSRITAPQPAAAPAGHRTGRRMTTGRIVGFCAILTATFAVFVACAVYVLTRLLRPSVADAAAAGCLLETKRRHDGESTSADSSGTIFSDPVKVIQLGKATTAFTYANIVAATSNFSDQAVVGAGGFGIVYKGVLPGGKVVAVKKLQRDGQEGEREFRAEMEALASGGHPNLVPLHGWCLYGGEKLLVYEYMTGGSLDEIIYDRKKLDEKRRMEMAIGVARALVYLHDECNPAVLHRDVKASNVMLDGDGRARLTDFGLARLLVHPEETHVSTMVAGTVGYVAPEYGHVWRATTKGDVYSFGVLLLELATARRAVDGGDECLVEWVRRVGGGGESHEGLRAAVVGVMIATGAEEEEVVEWLGEMCEMVRLGMRCTAESPHARPDMKAVLAALLRIAGGGPPAMASVEDV